MIAYGTPLVDDPDRIGDVTALGLDEMLFARPGRWRTQRWSTSIVDVTAGAAARRGRRPHRRGRVRVARRPTHRRGATHISWACWTCRAPTARPSTRCCPDAVQVADPFHLVKLANSQARRVPPPGPERDPRPPGPQGRPALPVPPAAHQGRRTPRRPRPHQAPRPARRRRPPRRGAHGLARQGGRPVIYDHRRPRPRRSSSSTGSATTSKTTRAPRGPPARPHHRPLAAPDRRLAPTPSVSNGPTEARQQPDQADQAHRRSGSAASPTTASASCSTPAAPTGTYSPPSLPAEIRRAANAAWSP